MSVLLNTQATWATIQNGQKLGYALSLNKECQSVENLKRFKGVSITCQQRMYTEENKLMKSFKQAFFARNRR